MLQDDDGWTCGRIHVMSHCCVFVARIKRTGPLPPSQPLNFLFLFAYKLPSSHPSVTPFPPYICLPHPRPLRFFLPLSYLPLHTCQATLLSQSPSRLLPPNTRGLVTGVSCSFIASRPEIPSCPALLLPAAHNGGEVAVRECEGR